MGRETSKGIKYFRVFETRNNNCEFHCLAGSEAQVERFALGCGYDLNHLHIQKAPIVLLTEESLKEILRAAALERLAEINHQIKRGHDGPPCKMFRVFLASDELVAYSSAENESKAISNVQRRMRTHLADLKAEEVTFSELLPNDGGVQ